jgi:hypothetical protein
MMLSVGHDDQPPRKVSEDFWGHLHSEDAWGSLAPTLLVHGRVLWMVKLRLTVLPLWSQLVIALLVSLCAFLLLVHLLMIGLLIAESSVPHVVILDDEISLEPPSDAVFRKAIASLVTMGLGLVIDPIIVD